MEVVYSVRCEEEGFEDKMVGALSEVGVSRVVGPCVVEVRSAGSFELRNRVLGGEMDRVVSRKVGAACVADRTQFAVAFEACAGAQELTPHQLEKLGGLGEDESAHVRGPAGAGKTSCALHRMLGAARRGRSVLFVGRGRALVMMVSRWILSRGGTIEVLDLTRGRRIERPRLENGRVETEACKRCSSYDLVVVDEAHHVYSCSAAREEVEAIEASTLLLLSDASQAAKSPHVPFPSGLTEVELTEVVRCSQRVAAGATAFQLGGDAKLATRCAHGFAGPPLKTLVFSSSSSKQTYATTVGRALQYLRDAFPGLELEGRVALCAPSKEFLEALVPELGFDVISAADSFVFVDEKKKKIVADVVDALDGLEWPFAVLVGLDGTGPEARSMLYRGLTRAQLAAVVVNEFVSDGWLEFLSTVRFEGEFDADREARRAAPLAADEAVTSRRRMELADAAAARGVRLGEKEVLLLLAEDDVPAEEALDRWEAEVRLATSRLASLAAPGSSSCCSSCRCEGLARRAVLEMRRGLDLDASLRAGLRERAVAERRRAIRADIPLDEEPWASFVVERALLMDDGGTARALEEWLEIKAELEARVPPAYLKEAAELVAAGEAVSTAAEKCAARARAEDLERKRRAALLAAFNNKSCSGAKEPPPPPSPCLDVLVSSDLAPAAAVARWRELYAAARLCLSREMNDVEKSLSIDELAAQVAAAAFPLLRRDSMSSSASECAREVLELRRRAQRREVEISAAIEDEARAQRLVLTDAALSKLQRRLAATWRGDKEDAKRAVAELKAQIVRRQVEQSIWDASENEIRCGSGSSVKFMPFDADANKRLEGDALLEIFGWLRLEAIGALSVVCKRWRAVSADPAWLPTRVAYAWGSAGASGLREDRPSNPAILPFSLKHEVLQLACANHATLALVASGGVYHWGESWGRETVSEPTRIEGLSDVVEISCTPPGYFHQRRNLEGFSCAAVDRRGGLYQWGSNLARQLLADDGSRRLIISAPRRVTTFFAPNDASRCEVLRAACGLDFVAVHLRIDNDQLVTCTRGTFNEERPHRLRAWSDWDGLALRRLVAGAFHLAALTVDGHLWTLGSKRGRDISNGNLLGTGPPGNDVEVFRPARVGNNNNNNDDLVFRDVAASTYATLAITHDGRALTWGDSDGFALGHGVYNCDAPAQVAALRGVHVARGALSYTNGAVATADGRLYVWGGADWEGGIAAFSSGDRPVPLDLCVAPCYKCTHVALGHDHGFLLFTRGDDSYF
ncbi:hypothetical protein CTAYLR_005662 [Chrysophaeum taylorii]|uniref:F-box domain-containing protein n=1 Tax=Chrysophaeum taylorii TaxID=2483200 RepID=A0AAD7UKN3_9STRA|nr:hypothetical protein CTAYLR_005662 [Chrysophaeum taylorii]